MNNGVNTIKSKGIILTNAMLTLQYHEDPDIKEIMPLMIILSGFISFVIFINKSYINE